MALPIGFLQGELSNFMSKYGSSDELYNEISLQLELGIYLRNSLSSLSDKTYKVQFERNIKSFQIGSKSQKNNFAKKFVKREIDLVIFDGDKPETSKERYAIELKFPINRQYPEEMYAFVTDMQFMEEVKKYAVFQETYCITLVDDPNFYMITPDQKSSGGIYGYFRESGKSISCVQKPTGKHKDTPAYNRNVSSSPVISWLTPKAGGNRRYYILKF